MNKWKQEGQLNKYNSGSSVITHIIKSQERFFHFTSHRTPLRFCGRARQQRPEMITEQECRSRLRPKYAFYAAGPDVKMFYLDQDYR